MITEIIRIHKINQIMDRIILVARTILIITIIREITIITAIIRQTGIIITTVAITQMITHPLMMGIQERMITKLPGKTSS